MSNTPQYGQSEYLDATTFNAMSAAVFASLQQMGATAMTPGLILPEKVGITTSALQATVTFPATFGIVFSNGTVAQAIGNTAGSITPTYIVNFASVVPISGTLTAHLLCTVSQVGQSSITVVGPPPGHPDWNPNFVPYTLYSLNQDSITVTASTTPPDNLTTFSLGTTTVTAGVTSLPAFNQNLIQRAGALSPKPVVLNSGTKTLQTASQGIIQNINNASTFTLPPVAGLNGMEFECTSATGGTVTVQAQGLDAIWGTGTAAVSSLTLVQGASAKFVAQNGAWYIMAASPNVASGGSTSTGGGGVTNVTVNNFTFNLSNPPTSFIDMDINDTLYISFTNVTSVPTFVNTHGGVFRVIICLSGVSQVNNDLFWKPNNTTFPGNSTIAAPGNFTLWSSESSDAPNPWSTSTILGYPFVAATPQTFTATTDGFGNTLGWFAMDAFGDGSRALSGDNINDLGPCMWDVLIGTSTLCKMMKFHGGVAGGVGTGVVRWYDTTTVWSTLGTFGIGASLAVNNPSTITGFCYITKIGGAIS